MIDRKSLEAFLKEQHSFKIADNALVSVDLSPHYWNDQIIGVWLSRILVPPGHRGKGYGSRALKLLCARLDQYNLDAFVMPNAYAVKDGLSQFNLTEWYKRHGFVKIMLDTHPIYRRTPTLNLKPG